MTRISHPSRLAAALVLLVVLGAGARPSHAATVRIQGCGSLPNHVFSPSGLASFGDTCTTSTLGGSLQAVAGGLATGSSYGWDLRLPAGTALTGGNLTLGTTVGSGSDGSQFVVSGLDASGGFHNLGLCGAAAGACPSGYFPYSITDARTLTQAPPLAYLGVRNYCSRGPGCSSASANISSYALNVDDDNPPRIVSRAGPVWTAGVWHHASDVLSGDIGNGAEGISNVTATLDGALTAVNPGCDYTALRVCPDATLATTLNGATDGAHHLTIAATTAAGIQATLYDDAHYMVDSNPPTAPLNVALDAPGESYSPAASRVLSWTNPSGQVAPITHAVIHVCRLDSGQCRDETASGINVQQARITPWAGGGAYRLVVVLRDQAGNTNDSPGGQSAPVTLRYDQRPASTLFASVRPLRMTCPHGGTHLRRAPTPRRRLRLSTCHVLGGHAGRVVRVRFGGHPTIFAVLTDAAGHALANEAIQILQRLGHRATTFTYVATATTDAAGRLRYRANPGPSRTLRLIYPGSDALKPALGDVTIQVPAFSSFNVDRQTAHLNQPVVFSGQVKGSPIPKGGLALQLEGRDYRTGWIPVSPAGKLRTDQGGRWRYTFVARRQGGPRFTYPFRLAILADPLYPYLPAVTSSTLVTVLNP